jgi:hypothetical protein
MLFRDKLSKTAIASQFNKKMHKYIAERLKLDIYWRGAVK